jgi:hypothetical protein
MGKKVLVNTVIRHTLKSEFGLTRQTIASALFYRYPRSRRKWNHDRYDRIRARAIELGGIEVDIPTENKEESDEHN